MPFKPIEQAKCGICDKSVYAAEERVAGGYKWHKGCFKCNMCNKMLDSTNCAPHQKQLFCKVCHGRKFGPKGYGFGGGAGSLTMDAGEQFGNTEKVSCGPRAAMGSKIIQAGEGEEGCPRCGGKVYAAELMLASGQGWHKTCFKCLICSRQLDSTSHNDGPDKEIYCKTCYGKKFGPKGYGFGGGAGALQSDVLDEGLVVPEFVKPSKNLEASIQAAPGEGCPRCGGVVYEAEKMLAKGSVWHKKCFTCGVCRRPLDSISACDGPDKDVYCRTCYGKKFGPKGYGFSMGAGFLQTDILTNGEDVDMMTGQPRWIPPEAMDTAAIKGNEGEGCPKCGGAVFAAEQCLAKGTVWHRKCFNCQDCRRPLDSLNACDGSDGQVYCSACYGKKFGPQAAPHDDKPSGKVAAPGEGCNRCKFEVYQAEMKISKGRVWHKRCFNCKECGKSLDSTNINDGPDSEIYCKGHYASRFGIKGIGFGMGGGVLQMG